MSVYNENRLPQTRFMNFPFRIDRNGARSTTRVQHIKEQIEQVLLTSPGERVFRPEFGFGARRMVFEPNAVQTWQIAQNRLYASLAETLAGEVDPKTLKVNVDAVPEAPEKLLVRISYVLAAIQKEEVHEIPI